MPVKFSQYMTLVSSCVLLVARGTGCIFIIASFFFHMLYLSPEVQGVIIAINLLHMFCPSPGVQGGCLELLRYVLPVARGTGCYNCNKSSSYVLPVARGTGWMLPVARGAECSNCNKSCSYVLPVARGTGCIFISVVNFLICFTFRPRYRVL